MTDKSNDSKSDVVILFSGGADSVLMLELAIEFGMNPYCILIDYSQLHREELEFACKYLISRNIDHQIVEINGLGINSGLTGNGQKNESGDVHEMHVPGRNSIFLSIAYGIAESKNISTIWIGCDWSDLINNFPDCKQIYLEKMNEAFKYAGPNPIKIEAPLIGLTKENVLKMLKQMGISDKDLFSGYGDL